MAKSNRSKPRKHTSQTRKQSSQPRTGTGRSSPLAPDWWLVALAGLGMIITGYLTGVAWSGSEVAFCTSGSGCDIVQQSRWSKILGIPVALWGFAVYTLIALSAALMKPRLRRWKRLWYLALVGLAISMYLTIVGIVALDAVCIWCLASLATMTAVFAYVCLRRPSSGPGMPWPQWAARSGIVVVVVLGLLHGYYSGLFRPAEDPRLKALAMHLEDTGAKFYGAYWCPNCQEQKDLFGASADRLPYVECTPDGRDGVMAFVCVMKDIQGYPTWIIDDQRHRGVLQPKELARYSDFEWENYDAGGDG